MSRIANRPITIPKGIEVKLSGFDLSVKGPKGTLSQQLTPFVTVEISEGNILVLTNPNAQCRKDQEKLSRSIAGTTRALLNNMVTGVSVGFEKKLQLVGVGYRAQAQGKVLNLTLGFSHPVNFAIPDGITIETPEPTIIVVKGTDKQLVGQVSANIRSYRPPEPYKGKGVRYTDEVVRRKESKKK
jgi:large subunit ribosomal protein L6